MSEPVSLLFLALLWSGWCALHSLLITRRAGEFLARRLGQRLAWFRIVYNLFSLITLVPVVLVHLRLQGQVLFAWSGPWQAIRWCGLAAAGGLLLGGARAYDMGYFLGWKQIRDYRNGAAAAGLNRAGILQYVRHPWYAAGILAVWFFGPVTAASLVAKVVLSGYLLLGTLLEERKLVAIFG